MRRKLIKQDTYDKIITESVSSAQQELNEASDFVAKTLGTDHLSLHSFTENTVMFETLDNTFIHAGYSINEGNIVFDGVEELIIDEETKKSKDRSILSNMVDALLENDNPKASQLFNQYLGEVKFTENKKRCGYMGKKNMGRKNMCHDMMDEKKKKMVKESALYAVAENVINYIKYLEYGPVLANSATKTDDKGNVVAIKIPTNRVRNENKLLSFNWKTLNHEVKELREHGKALVGSQEFCKQIADLKRHNALSDNEGLEEMLETIVNKHPTVLYLTQTELSNVIGEALNVIGATNYDDTTCDFMAEGILRMAQNVYSERANKVLRLARASQCGEGQDVYEHFQGVVHDFYPRVDEQFGVEKKVFADLYNAMTEVYKTADRRGDEALKHETASYLNDLAEILNDRVNPDISLAGEVATWLKHYVETNLETAPWNVSNDVHVTVSGDNPRMNQIAKVPYTPANDFSGDWGSELPVSDGKSYKGGLDKEMRNNSWGQEGGKPDVYPGLSNPYVPSSSDWTMKGEQGADKSWGQGQGSWQSSDTWPNLQNPYVPTSMVPKMNHGKEDDLVVNK